MSRQATPSPVLFEPSMLSDLLGLASAAFSSSCAGALSLVTSPPGSYSPGKSHGRLSTRSQLLWQSLWQLLWQLTAVEVFGGSILHQESHRFFAHLVVLQTYTQ